jgi:predicted RNA-binding Zn-ribbon protein involved in translation (DUF1610 family)
MSYHNGSPEANPPRVCTGCKRTYRNDDSLALCPHCGDEVIAQGFCPVCERYVPRPVGSLCPKHDIELDESPPIDERAASDGSAVSWVTVGRFEHSQAVAAPRIRLEAEGIPTFVEGERMGSVGMYRQAIGGVKLQVPAELVDEARIILAQNWALPSDEKADFEDLL